ncbi:hypothetical protein MIND_01405200 [Mycena indigotica]|uniref:Transmembrane protein n=1 Tax=Mycena indigotica TaxID=2126181 RepID=A0A8H6RXW2_9AGAR|nr:uncharacterized protein MIND_01405200 [Mycena indigotica]KAF7288892.1 hypothetical protein MIND_01405200 [Mycena indigotica]
MTSVIVDDRDSLISYSPSWKQDSSSLEFGGTTSMPPNQNAKAVFTFTGTEVSVYGSITGNPSHQTTLAVNIDGATNQLYLPTVAPGNIMHHQRIFSYSNLPAGQHTLTITNTDAIISTFLLDYITYTAPSRGSGQSVMIDDADWGKVSFSGTWGQDNNFDYFLQTSHHTSTRGEWVEVKYNFLDGDTLSLRGPLRGDSQSPLAATVSIDGGSPVSIPSKNAPSPGSTSYNNNLYTSPSLRGGQHTFRFTYSGGTALGVDYFLVQGGNSPPDDSHQPNPPPPPPPPPPTKPGDPGSSSTPNGPGTNPSGSSALPNGPASSGAALANPSGSLTGPTRSNGPLPSLGGAVITDSNGNVFSALGPVQTGTGSGKSGSDGSSSVGPGLSGSANPQNAASQHGPNLGLIIGIVCGVVGLLLLLLGVFCLRRRAQARRRKRIDSAFSFYTPQPASRSVSGTVPATMMANTVPPTPHSGTQMIMTVPDAGPVSATYQGHYTDYAGQAIDTQPTIHTNMANSYVVAGPTSNSTPITTTLDTNANLAVPPNYRSLVRDSQATLTNVPGVVVGAPAAAAAYGDEKVDEWEEDTRGGHSPVDGYGYGSGKIYEDEGINIRNSQYVSDDEWDRPDFKP